MCTQTRLYYILPNKSNEKHISGFARVPPLPRAKRFFFFFVPSHLFIFFRLKSSSYFCTRLHSRLFTRKREREHEEDAVQNDARARNLLSRETRNMFGAANNNTNTNAGGGLFGGGLNQNQGGGGLFGSNNNNNNNNNTNAPGMFGQQQQSAALGGGGGGGQGLFGNAGNNSTPFGTNSNQNQGGGGLGGAFGGNNPTQTSTSSGLFGNTNNNTPQQQQGGGGGGLFGNTNTAGFGQQQQQQQPASGGIFGNANTTNAATTQGGQGGGGLFGRPPTSGGGGLFGGGGAAGGSSLFGKPAGTTSTTGAGGGLFGGAGGGGGGLGNANTASGNQPNQSSGGSLFGGGLGQQQQQQQQTNTTPSLFGNRPSPLGATQPQNQQGLTQFQQQQNAFFNVPESITTQAQGGPTLFGGNLAPSEALLRARQQRHLASQPPASGTTLEPVKELHDVMNAYNPQHPEYRFKAFFYNIAQDPRQKVKIQNIDERTWHELLDKVGGEENENGLWPCRVDGFDGLYQREQAQEEELKSQEAFVNAYNQCIRQINSWKEGSYEVRRTQCERRREEHAHRVLKVMRKLESFRAAYHRRVNPQLSMRRGGGTAYNRGAVNGGSTFASKEERELFEVLQNLKRALDGSGKESLSRQAQQLTTTARVKTQELSRQLATSPLRGGGGSLFAGTTTANNGGYEINHQRTTTSPPSSSGQQQTKNKKKSNKPVLLQPYDRERAEVTKTDLDDLSSHKDVVDHLAGNIKSMREDLTRMCLAYGLQPVISATTTDPLSFQPQQQYQQQQQQQQQQNPAALAAHQYGTTTTPTRSTFF